MSPYWTTFIIDKQTWYHSVMNRIIRWSLHRRWYVVGNPGGRQTLYLSANVCVILCVAWICYRESWNLIFSVHLLQKWTLVIYTWTLLLYTCTLTCALKRIANYSWISVHLMFQSVDLTLTYSSCLGKSFVWKQPKSGWLTFDAAADRGGFPSI